MKKLLVVSILFMSTFAGAEMKDSVRQTMKSNLNTFRQCYEEGRKANPDLSGKVSLEWEFDGTGTVIKAGIKNSTLKDEKVETCMVEKLKTLKFPPSPDGQIARVVYPFVFTAK